MRSFLLLSFILLCIVSHAQHDIYKYRFLAKPVFGYAAPLTELQQGIYTDHLLSYRDNFFNLKFLSGSFFFHKHWGVDASIQVGFNPKIKKHDRMIYDEISNLYADYYNKTEYFGGYYNSSIATMNIGPTYRIQFNNLVLLSYLHVGQISFATNGDYFSLKKKNSNEILRVNLNSDDRQEEEAIFSFGGNFGFIISKTLMIMSDFSIFTFKPDITITKTETDVITLNTQIETYQYDKRIYHINLGIGVFVAMR